MPKPDSLVETKGWNRRSRTKAADMPWPRSITSMATSPPLSKKRSSTGSSRGARLDRVLDEMAERLLEPGRIGPGDQRRRRRSTSTGWTRRLAAAIASSSGWTSTGARRLGLARRAGREAGEQVVHLPDRALQRRDHVGAEFGIVGVALGVAGDEASWLTRFLMSCMMKAKRRLNSSKRRASASACWLRASAI